MHLAAALHEGANDWYTTSCVAEAPIERGDEDSFSGLFAGGFVIHF